MLHYSVEAESIFFSLSSLEKFSQFSSLRLLLCERSFEALYRIDTTFLQLSFYYELEFG